MCNQKHILEIASLNRATMHQQFTASGTFSDGTSQALTNQVTWSTDNISIVSIVSSGLATAIETGSATIKALHQPTGLSAEITVTVTGEDIVSFSIEPIDPSVAIGTEQQFTALLPQPQL